MNTHPPLDCTLLREESRRLLGARLPCVLAEIDKELGKELFDSARVADLLSSDPLCVAQVLRHSREPPAGPATPPATLQEAVNRLGADGLRRILRASDESSPPSDKGLDWHESRAPWSLLWERSLAKAWVARGLALECKANEDTAFLAALLDEVGRFILAQRHGMTYHRSWSSGKDEAGERDEFGTDHRREAGRLFRSWRLPPRLIAIVTRTADTTDEAEIVLQRIVECADQSADEGGFTSVMVRRTAEPRDGLRDELFVARAVRQRLQMDAFRVLERCARRWGGAWRIPGDLAPILRNVAAQKPPDPAPSVLTAQAASFEADTLDSDLAAALWLRRTCVDSHHCDRAFVFLHDVERQRYSEALRSEEAVLREPCVFSEDAFSGPAQRGPPFVLRREDAHDELQTVFETFRADEALLIPLTTRASEWPLGVLWVDRHYRAASVSAPERAWLHLIARSAAHNLQCRRLQNAVEEYREHAERDFLTGIHNRRSTIRQLEREILRARRTGSPLALALLDIDNFKTFNDVYGHLAGDTVLREVARLLSETARESDVVGRYGGEEFLVVLPDAPIEAAYMFAERLRGVVESYGIQKLHQFPDNPPTISIGVSWVLPDRDTSEAAIERADKALYGSKRSGRNRVCLEPAEPER